MMEPSDVYLVDRFVMALLYFANNGENWNYLSNLWLSNASVCEWTEVDMDGFDVGVARCSNGFVAKLDFCELNANFMIIYLLSIFSNITHLSLLKANMTTVHYLVCLIDTTTCT